MAAQTCAADRAIAPAVRRKSKSPGACQSAKTPAARCRRGKELFDVARIVAVNHNEVLVRKSGGSFEHFERLFRHCEERVNDGGDLIRSKTQLRAPSAQQSFVQTPIALGGGGEERGLNRIAQHLDQPA